MLVGNAGWHERGGQKPHADEQPIDVVRRFCAAWGTEDLDTIVGFFTDDAVYHNIPLAPVVGPDQIKATIEGFSGGVESIEFTPVEAPDCSVAGQEIDNGSNARLMEILRPAMDRSSAE